MQLYDFIGATGLEYRRHYSGTRDKGNRIARSITNIHGNWIYLVTGLLVSLLLPATHPFAIVAIRATAYAIITRVQVRVG